MAEESPQNSSKPQETSQDSGVSSEGQSSNPTGENAVVQSNQKSPTVTNQNSQSNKKYDLGVLFVHGIGLQKPGDTFEEMHEPIKEEIRENKEILFIELNKSIAEAECAVVTKGPQSQNKRTNVIFRESNWNGLGGNSSIPTGKWEYGKGALKAILYIIHALASVVLFGKLRIILGIIIAASMVIQYDVFNKSFNYAGEIYRYLKGCCHVDTILIAALVAVTFFLLWKFWGIFLKVINLIMSGEILHLIRCKILSFKDILIILYQQINNVVTYGYTLGANNYISQVTEDISGLRDESKKVMIIAHSMGGFLTHEALKSFISITPNTIYFNGVGSGLGPVTILRNRLLGKLELNKKYTTAWRVFSVVTISLGLFSFWYIRSIYEIATYLILTLRGDSINFPICAVIAPLLIIVFKAFLFISKRRVFEGQDNNFLQGVSWKEYAHFTDFIGNSATYVYGNHVELYRFMSSGRGFPIHVMPAYFNKGSIVLKSICDDILDILYGIPGRRPAYKEVIKLCMCLNFTLIATMFFGALVLLMLYNNHILGGNLDLGKFILSLVPSFVIMITFGFSLNLHWGTWSGHAIWEKNATDPNKKYAEKRHMQLMTVVLGISYSWIGYIFWRICSS